MAAEAVILSLVDRLANISIDGRTEALEELKTFITALSPSELRNIVPNISISNVFQCLDTENKPQKEICLEILDQILSTLTVQSVLHNFHPLLLTWISVDDDTIKTLILQQLSRVSREAPGELSQHEDLVLAVVNELASETQSVGLEAARVLTHLGEDLHGLAALFTGSVVEKFAGAMEKNDTARFRVYQVAIDLSVRSEHALNTIVQSGLFQQLVSETSSTDILIQLNSIELVSDLARSPHGLRFLDRQGVVSHLEDLLIHYGDNPYAGLLLTGLIKFFGGLARNHPKEVLSRFDHFIRLVLANVSSGDQSHRAVSVDTIGFIALTPEGKLALKKIGNPVTECIQCIGSIIQTGQPEMKARALQALANIIYLKVEDQTDELINLTERWFSTSLPNAFKTAWTISQQPFSDIRVPALHLLQSLALLPWGQKLMNDAPGFKEYVLNRATENIKEGKEEKFELVRILAHSPTTAEILGRPYQLKLMEYYKEGPFFVLAQSEVAMEGDT